MACADPSAQDKGKKRAMLIVSDHFDCLIRPIISQVSSRPESLLAAVIKRALAKVILAQRN